MLTCTHVAEQSRTKRECPQCATKLSKVLFRKNPPVFFAFPLKNFHADCSLSAPRSPPAMSLLRPSRGPCGPRRAQRLQGSVVVAVHRRVTSLPLPLLWRPQTTLAPSSSSSLTAAAAATPTSTPSTSTEPNDKQPLLPNSTSALRWSRRRAQASPSAGPSSWTWATTETSSPSPCPRTPFSNLDGLLLRAMPSGGEHVFLKT